MTKDRFQRFCQQLADCFLSGDPLELSRFYSYPLAIYHGEAVRVEPTPADTAVTVRARRARSRAAGTDRIAVTILELDRSEDARLRLRVSWSFLNRDGKPLDASVVVYYGTEAKDGEVRIGMIQFEAIAFPDTPYVSGKLHGPH